MSSGGVRNLRAMFENSNAAATPPERGRSPAGSFGAGSNGTSPRPLSKVRTSFVTVEKGGQIGIRRDTSGEPSLTNRRTSFSIDEEDPKVEDRKQSIAEELQVRKDSAVAETIPEVAVEMEEDKQPAVKRGRESAKPKEVPKIVEKKETSIPNKEDIVPRRLDTPKAGKARSEAPVKQVSTPKPVEATAVEQKKESTKPRESVQPKEVPKETPKPIAKSTPKPTPIAVAKASTPAKTSPKKTNPLPRTPITPQPSKSIEKSAEKKSTPKSNVGATPPYNGFVKPRPRSPTRPVKLPASLTAHTASSGSKTAVTSTNTQVPTRSLSRASTTSSATRTLNRKPSTLNKTTSSRPSLGPPPTSQTKKEPARTSLPGPAGEDFLARMMRPTASSASKTQQAHQTTPPKKVLPKVKQVMKKVVKMDEEKVESPQKREDRQQEGPKGVAEHEIPSEEAKQEDLSIEEETKEDLKEEDGKKEEQDVVKAVDQKQEVEQEVEALPISGILPDTKPEPSSSAAIESDKAIEEVSSNDVAKLEESIPAETRAPEESSKDDVPSKVETADDVKTKNTESKVNGITPAAAIASQGEEEKDISEKE